MTTQYILDEISSQIEELENNFGFKNSAGFLQVQGTGETNNRYYGKYEALVLLYED